MERAFTQMPDTCFIPAFEVKLQQLIKSENVGGNYRVLWLNAEVVVKLFVPEASATTFAHEMAVWHQLRHPNVIKLYGTCDIDHHFFVCEWASNGSLIEHLAAREKRGERRTPWKFLHEAALGLAYLHERKIVHGNLCSNNILVGSDGLVKLADFQLSGSTTVWSSGGRSDVGSGSFCWHAPERLNGKPVSLASDIYSFCLCVIAVVTRKTPWGGCLEYHYKSKKIAWNPIADRGGYYAPVHDMTPDLTTLASKLGGNDPHSRVPASEVVRMLERLASQEAKEQQQSQSNSELILHINEYKNGDLLRRWRKLQLVTETVAADQPQFAVCRELKNLSRRTKTTSNTSTRFYKLIADCIGIIDVSSHQNRIQRLSSTKAQGHSITAIHRRIDAICAVIDSNYAIEEHKLRREKQRLKQQEAFVSEVSQTLVVLNELETDEARRDFMAFGD
ncbi:LOW QUALITY PROTEIN: Serine/threonine protein kinase [Phytophthora palmivora]|uniref:Serine/threonine protein kinase n=1 Tax=Phytophthora palmivora TaxID=4796 RepID=A0A2P4YJU0_9STRA|nr:LOW QUALITY PROTEIN: Serine/threonine protein kinase [Phytophthora palmivora]